MDDETSIVAPPRDYSNIFQLQDPIVLDDFLRESLTFVAETITGALAVGKTGALVAGGRIVQALLKGQAFKQWGKEFHALRDAGKIPDDFAEKKYGFQTWVKLMTIIDEESPDADRLEALKAAFYAVNKVGVEDQGRIVEYQLWRVSKQLNSGDVLLLKTFYEKDHHFGEMQYGQWLAQLTSLSGMEIMELVQLHLSRLLEFRLLIEPQNALTQKKAEISGFGRRLYANINIYRIDLESAARQTSE
jgi:hypothetical protein